MAFADNLKRLREKKGLTQAELAERADVSQPMITLYEKNRKTPTVIVGVDLAKALDTTCEKLVLGCDEN